MAKHDIAVTSWTHAGGESSRPHLTDGGSEQTPSRNKLLLSTFFPEITEELSQPSEESDDQHASSAREEVQINKVNVTLSDPAATKPLSDPLKTMSSESNRSATQDLITDSLLLLCHEEKERSGEGKDEDNSEPVEKIQEEAQIDGTVSLASSSGEISEKQGRKKRIMKRLGLGTSKRSKTSKSGTPRQSSLDQPNVALGSQVVTQNTSVSSHVRSRKASEKGNVVEVSPATKRIDQFLRRNIIDERLIYEQRVAKAKGKAKEVAEGRMSSRSTRMPPHVPSPSMAPTSSNMTGPRCFVVHDLGSVSIPQGLLTQDELQAVLQQTTWALQALTDITHILKRGRLKMYGQNGATVVHEVRHEIRH
ncbi:LOW QUALITY PROTEIN: hypothetical protein HID58_069476 [Brassica napus]|uniref:Uncharacterized protein n=1 Tax=Brassica napus TaxID=3708 RepID=A0ABQ7YVZ3_BRANA|nr:LOW QUALITY PROTEIN: hypothetical protein HID58_069476 [Brassica napus]